MDKIFYRHFKVHNITEIENIFVKTAITTNRDFRFFVDWDKIKKIIDKHKLEIALFDTLIKSKNFDKDLKNLLNKYPKAVEVVPMLLALSEKDRSLVLVDDFLNWNFTEHTYNFDANKFDPKKDLQRVVNFFDKTGLKKFFIEMSCKSILDYAIGVEVGMDTNARKNRSGTVMEKLLTEVIKSYNLNYSIYTQKKFKTLKGILGTEFDTLSNRKADFILVKNGSDKKIWINIEVNFYNTSGSKPEEIVDAYINRQNEIKKKGGRFIWISDGAAWKAKNNKQQNQIKKAFENLDYVLNLHFVKDGLLKEILASL